MYSTLYDGKPIQFGSCVCNPELSNFSGCNVRFFDNLYPSAEHAYVAWRLGIHCVRENILTISGDLATFESFREKYDEFCSTSDAKFTSKQKEKFEGSMFDFWAKPAFSHNPVGIIAKKLCSTSDPIMIKFRKWLRLSELKPEKKPNAEVEMSEEEKAVWNAIHQSKFSDDNEKMKAALLDTGNSLLIEFDKGTQKSGGSFWGGMVLGGINNLKPDPETGKFKAVVLGRNEMGKLLCARRSELQKTL